MKIAMIGAGYVGLTTGALFADRGHEVVCVDNNPEIINSLNNGKLHIFEPGLKEIVERTTQRKKLYFSTDLAQTVVGSDIIFIAVGTPSYDSDGSFNLDYVRQAAHDIGRALSNARGFKVVVGKSTVPQKTWETISEIINKELGSSPNVEWAYVSNPETLSEGTAVRDFEEPDRVLIGTYSDKAFNIMEQLYYPFVRRERQIIRGSPADAELAKLASNTALAMRVAMINEIARTVDVTSGADMEIVRQMMGADKRIGYTFLFPSPGYGGSCFPKDVRGLVQQAIQDGFNPLLLSGIHESNEAHKKYIGERVMNLFRQKDKPRIAILGLTFKPGTDDMRDAASIPIITHFINKGARVSVYDPQDRKARKIFGDKVNFCNDQYEAAKDADALVLLTEWREFDAPDYNQLKNLMRGRQLFDLRNRWIPKVANENGFDYFGVGRNYPLDKSPDE